MKPILKWQYDQLIKALLLLQEHWATPDCPCKTDGESCVRKHLLTIEAYADETQSIEPSDGKRADLLSLSLEAKQLREVEEANLCGKSREYPVNLDTWARDKRKSLEDYSLACELLAAGNPSPEQHRCVEAVQAKINKGDLPEDSDPWAICQSKIKGVTHG